MRRLLSRTKFVAATSALAAVAVCASLGLTPASATAGPREDMRAAYDDGLRLFNDLELEQAIGRVNQGIMAAESAGKGNDPFVASLYMMKAALLYSSQGDGASSLILEMLEKAVRLNYYVVVPAEFRSPELSGYLMKARQRSGVQPGAPITHTTPSPACGGDVVFEALLGVPDGGQAALYWRVKGSGRDFTSISMETFSNVADAVVTAPDHGDADLEYFIYAFDANNNPVANLGTQEAPMVLAQKCTTITPDGGGDTGDGGEKEPEEGKGDGKKDKGTDKGGATTLPRVWINLGVGTGFGIARGSAEQTYQQYFPSSQNSLYGPEQEACAIARWAAGEGSLEGNPANLADEFTTYAGGNAMEVLAAYDAGVCGARHQVNTGLASAPFHIAPEIQFRIAKRMSLSLFSRLQVVSGSKVYRDDPTKQLGNPAMLEPGTSWHDDVYPISTAGDPVSKFRSKPPFSWSIGVKFRYYLLKDTSKFRLFIGGMAGYGSSRLRVDMGFGNDLNGNSVPDDFEVPRDFVPGNDVATCYAVWPWNGACGGATEAQDVALATNVRSAYGSSGLGNRIDTVKIGPGFVGAVFGFNYQIVKNFALYGELDLGGWFPDQGSMLIDLTVGPAISF